MDKEHQQHNLHQQDADFRCFLAGMCQTYCSLTSADDPDIFDINYDQKHILNQLIHFALKNWEARQTWYHERQCSAINNNSTFCLVP